MVRVVIVDDSSFMRKVLKDIIESMGWAVVGEAVNGEEAIDICAKLGPDLVTMDVVMPGIGGEEATKKIKGVNPDIKVVMVTAVGGQKSIISEAIAAGAEKDSITKPFKEDFIKETLKRIMGK